MNILITGAYGFVGTNLTQYLISHGHTVDALDLPQADSHGASSVTHSFTWNDLESIPWETFDAVVHLAGKAHDTKNTSSAQSYFDINLGLTQKVFSACLGKSRRFIFFSSVKASADQVDGVLIERSIEECHPGTPYGESKLAAEQWLFEKCCSDEAGKCGCNVYVLRPAMIHGPGNKGNLNLLCQVARRGLPWPLGAFENLRSFTSVDNACMVVEAFCAGKAMPGTYQLADDNPVSTNRLIDLISQATGKRTKIWKLPKNLICGIAKIGDYLHLPLNSERLKKLSESYVVSNEKLKKALGWKTMPVSAEDGLRKTLKRML